MKFWVLYGKGIVCKKFHFRSQQKLSRSYLMSIRPPPPNSAVCCSVMTKLSLIIEFYKLSSKPQKIHTNEVTAELWRHLLCSGCHILRKFVFSIFGQFDWYLAPGTNSRRFSKSKAIFYIRGQYQEDISNFFCNFCLGKSDRHSLTIDLSMAAN